MQLFLISLKKSYVSFCFVSFFLLGVYGGLACDFLNIDEVAKTYETSANITYQPYIVNPNKTVTERHLSRYLRGRFVPLQMKG